ncbi:ABC transporter ATP-binding protein [Xinfangfangia sp. CPCC 101601]|uniref:ABC transporter ATP-binding protein n=1 Tax=Pseudogemmobacter lacusdianii TaxID=3069608 RepID=A0ABU0VTR9_9RHOB|nr:ABC transporter ATP-binding protein [Xinfangfangia sp. CPCC 101601]MDQ2065127.1 ABC transporter ATP-binding protein [Xinfangfangia sp. CPCC 101601]
MMKSAEPVLSVEGLSLSYDTPHGELLALRDVSLTIGRGEIVGLVGESGSGKSSLMQAILQLMPGAARVTSGRILFEGQDLVALGPDGMAELLGDRISVVFQDPMTALNPVLTIARQMIDIQHRRKESRAAKRQRAIEMLRRVRIPDVESKIDRYPHEFSGGMRQRIAIAMALMAEPALLVADEPTTALDATLEIATINLLRELQQEIGCAILFITHHLGVVAELCDRIDIMYAGELVESGPVGPVFADPRHPYTQLLFACDPAQIVETTRHLPAIGGGLPDLIDLPEGCVFAPRCPRADDVCRMQRPADHSAASSDLVRCHYPQAPRLEILP